MSQTNGKDRKPRRRFTADEKATILRRHLADKDAVSDLCDEYQIQPTLFYLWQRQALERLSEVLQDGRKVRGEAQVASADRAPGRTARSPARPERRDNRRYRVGASRVETKLGES